MCYCSCVEEGVWSSGEMLVLWYTRNMKALCFREVLQGFERVCSWVDREANKTTTSTLLTDVAAEGISFHWGDASAWRAPSSGAGVRPPLPLHLILDNFDLLQGRLISNQSAD